MAQAAATRFTLATTKLGIRSVLIVFFSAISSNLPEEVLL
jgi:hypothetical protein